MSKGNELLGSLPWPNTSLNYTYFEMDEKFALDKVQCQKWIHLTNPSSWDKV